MSDQQEMTVRGDEGPWWIAAVYRLGVPSAIAAFLLWYLVSNVSANIAAIRQDVRDHVTESAVYLSAICLNTAKDDAIAIARCQGHR